MNDSGACDGHITRTTQDALLRRSVAIITNGRASKLRCGPMAVGAAQASERCMHPLIESHRSEIRALAQRHGFRDVRVFGSMVRGDVDERSDVDLLVTLPAGKTGLALGALLMDVQDLLGRRVDVVTENCLHPAFRNRVLREAQTL